ncbi:uncharacterized protein METZ01_LOCUS401616 [marine metagenome]|uniref:Uncharacterized protein n=1 Tax=marine metagenome TaxID=408172 RepID=A0A382VQJ2_9ZZZZ
MRKNQNINLDVLNTVLNATTLSNLARIHAKDTAPRTSTPLTKDQAGRAKRMHAKWQAHTTGNAYVLYVQNRTSDHSFRVQSHGKNAWQAVRRYYKGLDNKGNWVWQCTKVVAVYSCANDQVAQAGKLLHGQAQDRAPW